MTLKQIFDKYPLIVSKIAQHHGYSREWLAGLISGRIQLSPEKRAEHIKMIQTYINQIGSELAKVKITDPHGTRKSD